MGGLVIDIVVGFLVRWLVILWRKAQSHDWPTVPGRVVRSHFEQPGYGGSYVEVRFKYKIDGERYQGILRKPFIFENYADAFVRHHPADSELRVHVDPKDPARSFPVPS